MRRIKKSASSFGHNIRRLNLVNSIFSMNTKECYRGVRRRAVAGVWRKGRQERGHHTIMDTYTCTLTFVYITQGVIKMGGGGIFFVYCFSFSQRKK